MRRFGSLIALALVLSGVELTTRGVSLTVARLGSGVSAVMNGLTLPISSGRFVIGLVLIVVGVLLGLLSALVRRVEVKANAAGQRCPSCGGETHRVKRNRVQRFLSTLVGEDLASRQCDDCGWAGLAWRY